MTAIGSYLKNMRVPLQTLSELRRQRQYELRECAIIEARRIFNSPLYGSIEQRECLAQEWVKNCQNSGGPL